MFCFGLYVIWKIVCGSNKNVIEKVEYETYKVQVENVEEGDEENEEVNG